MNLVQNKILDLTMIVFIFHYIYFTNNFREDLVIMTKITPYMHPVRSKSVCIQESCMGYFHYLWGSYVP